MQGNARAARATVVSAFKRTFLHLRPPSSRNLCNVIEHINAPKETFPKKFSVETKNLIRRGGSGGTIDNAQRKKKVFIGNLSPWITEGLLCALPEHTYMSILILYHICV